MMPHMGIVYHSTRGNAPQHDLRGVTMTGLAADGGLYVPTAWPGFALDAIVALKGQSYQAIAEYVLRPFTAGIFSDAILRQLIDKAYSSFSDPAITPLKQLDDRHWVLELFHGPTLAFKDVALQLLGEVFEFFLAEKRERMTVVGATSGDTGSAAIAALAGRSNIDVFILYPNKGPSEIQRKQMTCVDAPNVHAIAVEGSFDDCQAIVKAMFNDPALRAKYNLAAVNSINWLRILAQMVYYFAASAQIAVPKRELGVCVADIGASTTELAVFFEGSIAHTAVLPLGGDHFTNDLAVGLHVTVEEAEELKRMYGNCVVTAVPQLNEIEIGREQPRLVRQRFLAEILEPRARELFTMLRDNLRQGGVLEALGAGCVLTGGGARMVGLQDNAESLLRVPVRVGSPVPMSRMPAELAGPEFATAVGMLLYTHRTQIRRAHETQGFRAKLRGIFAGNA